MLSNSRGFTLIELLIVVAIIGILAAIAIPNFLQAQTRAKVANAKSDLRTVAVAMEAYFVDYDSYPRDYNDSPFDASMQGDGAPTIIEESPNVPVGLSGAPVWVLSWRSLQALTTPVEFLTSLPDDPFYTNCPFGYDSQMGSAGTNFVRGYMLTSMGPDTKVGDWMYNLIVGPGNAGIWYDPSNGTISLGDMWKAEDPTNRWQDILD